MNQHEEIFLFRLFGENKFLMSCVSTEEVILGRNTIRYIRGKILDSLIMTHATLLWKSVGGNEVERTGMTEMRTAELLAVREA